MLKPILMTALKTAIVVAIGSLALWAAKKAPVVGPLAAKLDAVG